MEVHRDFLSELDHYSEPGNDSIKQMADTCWAIAKAKGWNDGKGTRDPLPAMLLMHSEISEAVEFLRLPDVDIDSIWYEEDGKPEGCIIELADVVIRIMDFAEQHDLDLSSAILAKMRYNLTREYRHGGKKF